MGHAQPIVSLRCTNGFKLKLTKLELQLYSCRGKVLKITAGPF